MWCVHDVCLFGEAGGSLYGWETFAGCTPVKGFLPGDQHDSAERIRMKTSHRAEILCEHFAVPGFERLHEIIRCIFGFVRDLFQFQGASGGMVRAKRAWVFVWRVVMHQPE